MAKTIQYINIIKEDKQLRIYSQVQTKNQVVSNDLQTLVLPDKNNITNEAIENIKALIAKHKNTKVATLCEQVHQKALLNHLWVNEEKNKTYFIDSHHKAVASKIYVDSLLHSFKDVQIDYLYSPYSILYNVVPESSCDKTVYALIINDIIYMSAFKQNKLSIMSKVVKIMSYSEIEKSEFYSDDTQKQIFFNQMYALELENAISNFVDEWYVATGNHQKLEKILIACNIKQLSNDAIESIKENLGFLIQYESVDINQYLLALNKVPNIQSFASAPKRNWFSFISIKDMISDYYHISKKSRKRGYIFALIAGVIAYKISPSLSDVILEKINRFVLLFFA